MNIGLSILSGALAALISLEIFGAFRESMYLSTFKPIVRDVAPVGFWLLTLFFCATVLFLTWAALSFW